MKKYCGLWRHLVSVALFASVASTGTQAAEQTITVTSAPGDTAAGADVMRRGNIGLLGYQDTLKTPFSLSGFGEKYIAERQVTSLGQVLARDASVRVSSPSGGILDSFMIRGFPIGEGNIGEVALNGVYGVAPNYQLLTAYIQRVELLKGPTTGLYGTSPNGGVGGVINVVTKRATAQPVTRITTRWESQSQFASYLDMGRLWQTTDGSTFGVRLNAGGSGGNMALHHTSKRTGLGALALDYSQDSWRVSMDLLDQYQKVRSPNRPMLVAAGLAVPAAPDGKINIAQPGMWWSIRDQGALLHSEYDIHDNMTLFASAGGGRTIVARVSEQTPVIIDAASNLSSTITNYRFNVNRYTLETGWRGNFTYSMLEHHLVLQANYYHDNLALDGVSGEMVTSNLYHPRDMKVPVPAAPASVPRRSSTQLYSVALADTLSLFNEQLSVIPGVRQQWIRADNFMPNGQVSSRYHSAAFSPVLGIAWRPLSPLLLYANYIEGLSKGDIAPGTARNAGQVMKPYRSRQLEAGVKYAAHNLLGTISLFQITRPSGALNASKDFTVNSEQRNRGVELSLGGEPLAGLHVQGSVSLINARLSRAATASIVGHQPVGVSPVQANVAMEYKLAALPGVSLNGQLTYSGKQYVDQANTQSINNWTTLDVGAAYSTRILNADTTFRFDVANLFNRAYWTGVASYSTIAHGAPRTFLVSLVVDF